MEMSEKQKEILDKAEDLILRRVDHVRPHSGIAEGKRSRDR